jgi:hypothetical protein
MENPEGGYFYKTNPDSPIPLLSKEWKVSSPRLITLVWVEVYGLNSDNSLT